MKANVKHKLFYECSTLGFFVRLYHVVEGERVQLGTITRGQDGLQFTAAHRCALDAEQLWQIMTYMVEHKYMTAAEIAPIHTVEYEL